MNTQAAVRSQYLAALKMLRQAIVKCPPTVWDAPQDKDRFWYKAQHALYWAQVDLKATHKDFVPWKGRSKTEAGLLIPKSELLEHLAFLEQQVAGRQPAVGSAGSSRSHGFRLDKLERVIGNIRHIQQHTGELYERLDTRTDTKLHWVEHVHRKIR